MLKTSEGVLDLQKIPIVGEEIKKFDQLVSTSTLQEATAEMLAKWGIKIEVQFPNLSREIIQQGSVLLIATHLQRLYREFVTM